MALAGLKDMCGHFLLCHKTLLKDNRMWYMRCGGREVGSRITFILGIDRCLLQNMAVWDARHNMDHYLVLSCVCEATPAAHLPYLGKRTRFPIKPP